MPYSVVGGGRIVADTEQFAHLFVEEAFARAIGLDPDAVDDKLRDGTLAGAGENLLRCAGRLLDINLFVGNVVLGEKSFGNAAVRAPTGRVNNKFHFALRVLTSGEYGEPHSTAWMIQSRIGREKTACDMFGGAAASRGSVVRIARGCSGGPWVRSS